MVNAQQYENSMHHLVSRGYQANFADRYVNRVALLDARSGQILSPATPIRSNWQVQGFLTRTNPQDGERDATLESEFAEVEHVAIRQMREVGELRKIAPEVRASIDRLASMHLLRSEEFVARHGRFVAENRDPLVDEVVDKALTSAGSDFDREKLRSFALDEYDNSVVFDNHPVAAMRRLWPKVTAILSPLRAQLIVSPEPLPGFILPDQPVMIAHSDSGRFGFRDTLAVGEADTILMPLSRRVLLAYAVSFRPTITLSTKKGVQRINAVLSRGASTEIICHPDDALESSRIVASRDRFPISMLSDGRLGRHARRK